MKDREAMIMQIWSRLMRGLLSAGLLFLPVSCNSYYEGKVSGHWDGSRFFNPGKPMEKSFIDLLKWKLGVRPEPWPAFAELKAYDHPPRRVLGKELRISSVGHVTVLLQTGGVNILTDPVWSERVSPFSFLGPKRVHPPGVRFAQLPPVDVVLISHNHYDHLDLKTIRDLWLRDRPRIIAPLGNDRIIQRKYPDIAVETFDWGETAVINPEMAIHLEPMHHWSARSPFDHNKALWAAFVVAAEGGNIYFAGDSGYGQGDYFRAAREKFKEFRLAILPIGAYEPRWFMSYQHMNPAETVQAFHDLGGPMVLPTHHSVFPLADDGYAQPLGDLRAALAADGEAGKRFLPLLPGASVTIR